MLLYLFSFAYMYIQSFWKNILKAVPQDHPWEGDLLG